MKIVDEKGTNVQLSLRRCLSKLGHVHEILTLSTGQSNGLDPAAARGMLHILQALAEDLQFANDNVVAMSKRRQRLFPANDGGGTNIPVT